MTTIEIHRVEDRTSDPPRILFAYRAMFDGRQEYFKTLEEAEIFKRGYEAGLEAGR